MNKIFALLLVLVSTCSSCLRTNSASEQGERDLLIDLVKNKTIPGIISTVNGDTVIRLMSRDPLYDLAVDTIYFCEINQSIFRVLFGTPFQKGLCYVEGRRGTESFKSYTDFGGWVQQVHSVNFDTKGSFSDLEFKIDVSSSFESGFTGQCLIESSNDSSEFNVIFKDLAQ